MKRDLYANVRGKCRKANPLTCRLHGRKVQERSAFQRELRYRQEELAFKTKTDPDFAASWKPKTSPDGVTTVSVYRSGVVEAPAQRGVEAASYMNADALKPEGRQGRTTGIFAAPTIGGVCRWVRGNYNTKIEDVKVRELTVDVDKVYVYSIPAWEKASSWENEDSYREYWNSGITLREYMKKAVNEPKKYNPQEWELLLSPEDVKSAKPVGAERTAAQAYDETHQKEVKGILSDKPRHLWK